MKETAAEISDIERSLNFLEEIVENDIKENKNNGRVHLRFPPEPNGYLHIGHASSICLNFGLAQKYKGLCNLRFDDTNPSRESDEYVQAIKRDIAWLGFVWHKELFASDYFEQLYQWALQLIEAGKAYVCHLSREQMSEYRGTPTTVGKESPYRNRSVAENLQLFERMYRGEFAEGECVLRAKIDMTSPNIHMRDPVMYRIMHAHHHRTGNKWHIYPSYDYAHGQSDYIEGITHSVCTLEFEVHRPLYDWFLDQLGAIQNNRPHQYEFARVNVNYTVMSKRKLLRLVNDKFVSGWDDPRMPTVSGLRRRGYTPEAIRMFADKAGIAKREKVVDVALLEFCIREDLNRRSQRIMAVVNPLKVVITNFEVGKTEIIDAVNNPEDESMGRRSVPLTREIYIERDDFMENPPKGYHRLSVGAEVRLRYAYFIKCTGFVKDDKTGEITEIHCTYDPASRSGQTPDGRKVKGIIHWVSAEHALPAEVRLYDRLFSAESPDEGDDFTQFLNPDSLRVVKGYIEPFAANTQVGDKFQFERLGYFCTDLDSKPENLVFNRTVTLKDTWAKMQSKQS